MSMASRDTELYVERKTIKRLWLIAKAWPVVPEPGRTQLATLTADEVGDRLLNELIERDYPDVIAAEAEINAVEADLARKLRVKAGAK